MKLLIPKEHAAGETRVACVPDMVKRYRQKQIDVLVEAGAGTSAGYEDQAYADAGAEIVGPDAIGQADMVVAVNPPGDEQIGRLKQGCLWISFFKPAQNGELLGKLAQAGVSAMAVDRVPRITRAQSMDALSSQSNIAGYKAVLVAAEALPRLMPMMTTAAGTVKPAQALVIGAGVAGLQAIATAKRLGALVKGVDTRPAVAEQVESLGAKFIPLEVHHEAEDAGGYATDLGEEFYKQEQDVLAEHVAGADVIVTTAMIPNRKAPVLITEAMVESMKPGSVIVDLAAAAGGNCTLTQPDQRVEAHGVTIFGPTNLPAAAAFHASALYARNLLELLGELLGDEPGQLNFDTENEVIRDTLVVHDGQVRFET